MSGATGVVAVAILCVVAGSVAIDRTALAQAGSTGGAIGKTDKSVSGAEEGDSRQSSPKPRRHTAGQGVAPRSHDAAINLTGTWSGDDGGIYTIRQSGSKVSWEGVGTVYTHTFNGVTRDGAIDGRWVDHPPGMNIEKFRGLEGKNCRRQSNGKGEQYPSRFRCERLDAAKKIGMALRTPCGGSRSRPSTAPILLCRAAISCTRKEAEVRVCVSQSL
jgi:hypothetical protein